MGASGESVREKIHEFFSRGQRGNVAVGGDVGRRCQRLKPIGLNLSVWVGATIGRITDLWEAGPEPEEKLEAACFGGAVSGINRR